MAVVVEYKLIGIEALTRSQVINALKRALVKLGEYWHFAMAWKRFTPLGYSEYNFRQRSAKYNRRKIRFRGHANPLELTGEGKEEALGESTRSRIRATRDSVTIPLPRKFNLYNPRGPNMSEEVRAVSRPEIDVLQENLVLFIDEELEAAVPAESRGSAPRVARLKLSGLRGGQRIITPISRRIAA